MPDIRIHRDHALGLAKARKAARAWAKEVQARFGIECTVIEGRRQDTVEFTRSGVKGQLVVAADHVDLSATFSWLLSAFAPTIRSQIEKELDAVLAKQAVRRSRSAG
jgi:putative polyhydroxyalkanoate system protein